MSITDGTVLRIVANMLWTDGNVNQNIYNAVMTGAGAPWDEQDVLDDMEDWLDNMYANFSAYCAPDIDGNSVHVYEYDSVDDDWDEIGVNDWTWSPTAGTTELPRGVAGLVRLWTTDPDVQGKKYVPGFVEGNLVDGLWSAGPIAALLAYGLDWATPFVGAATGGTITPGIWSVASTLFVAAVDHYATSTIPAYQRRRKRNVGI